MDFHANTVEVLISHKKQIDAAAAVLERLVAQPIPRGYVPRRSNTRAVNNLTMPFIVKTTTRQDRPISLIKMFIPLG
jgi:hypothetical protein